MSCETFKIEDILANLQEYAVGDKILVFPENGIPYAIDSMSGDFEVKEIPFLKIHETFQDLATTAYEGLYEDTSSKMVFLYLFSFSATQVLSL